MSNRQLLERWSDKAKSYRDGHVADERRHLFWHHMFGFPTAVLSVVGAVWGQNQTLSPTMKMVVTGCSFALAALTSLRSFYPAAKKAEAHKVAHNGYSDLCRHLDSLKADYDEAPFDTARMHEVKAGVLQSFKELELSPTPSQRGQQPGTWWRLGNASKLKRVSDADFPSEPGQSGFMKRGSAPLSDFPPAPDRKKTDIWG